MNVETLLLAGDTSPSEQHPRHKVSKPLAALLDDDQLLFISPKLPLFAYEEGFEVVGEECGLSPPITLCKPCKRLMQSPPPAPPLNNYVHSMEKPELWIPFHTNLSQFLDCCYNSEGTCRICCIIWDRVCTTIRRSINPPGLFERGSTLALPNFTQIARFIDWTGGQLKLGLLNKGTDKVELYVNLGIPEPYTLDWGFLQSIETSESNGFQSDVTSGRIVFGDDPSLSMSTSTDSPVTISRIKWWLESCKRDHPGCKTLLQKDGRPTRLVRIEDGGTTFRMMEDLQEDVEYVAISYRWGSNKKAYKLDSSTLQSIREGNPIGVLPKTLREVCDIAHRLGFEYVWIDRLCIIQDHQEDWQTEASRMAMVYTQASCTIAASCASNEDKGCLRERNPNFIVPLWLKSCPLSDSQNIIIYNKNSLDWWWHSRHDCLEERGWVFQEWLLSTRIIRFSQNQVYWECRQAETSEIWPSFSRLYGRDLISRPSFTARGPKTWSATEAWMDIVENYSGKKFTSQKDILPAISGLAKAVEKIAGGELGQYLAGLWRTNFIQWLCWSVDAGAAMGLPKEYIAPSWSWASRPSTTAFLCLDFTSNGKYGGFTSCKVDEYLTELKHVELAYVSDIDSYGALRDGWIVLSGHMRQVWVDKAVSAHWGYISDLENGYSEDADSDLDYLNSDGSDSDGLNSEDSDCEDLDSDDSYSGILPSRGEDGDRPMAFLDFADWSTVPPSTPIYCLPLVKAKAKITPLRNVYCLLLVPCASLRRNRPPPIGSILPRPPDLEEFERVGITTLYLNRNICPGSFSRWLSQCPKRDIVIR